MFRETKMLVGHLCRKTGKEEVKKKWNFIFRNKNHNNLYLWLFFFFFFFFCWYRAVYNAVAYFSVWSNSELTFSGSSSDTDAQQNEQWCTSRHFRSSSSPAFGSPSLSPKCRRGATFPLVLSASTFRSHRRGSSACTLPDIVSSRTLTPSVHPKIFSVVSFFGILCLI